MVSFKRRLQMGGSILLPLMFSGIALADAPVVDLVAKPENISSGYVAPQRSIEQRLQLLERKMDNDALIDLYQRLETLQVEVQQLRGLQEEEAHDIAGIKQRQRDLYLDLDQRINSLQLSVKQLRASPPAPAAGLPKSSETVDGAVAPTGMSADADMASTPPSRQTVPVPSTGEGVLLSPPIDVMPEIQPPATSDSGPSSAAAPEPINSLKEQADYQVALDLLMDGHYEQAIDAFTSFLAHYPDGEYRMNAQYWLGEAYYVRRLFDQAIESFSQVIADKNARKRPDAMLKTGYSFYEQKRWRECSDILQQLSSEYPQSAASGLATLRLQMLQASNLL